MLLKSLRMHNFRQYKGEQTVTFSSNRDQNVTVILGENTFGKTTLLQAFNWCFYDTVLLDNPDELLNYEYAETMQNGDSAEVEVEIVLVHSNFEYTLTRFEEFKKTSGKITGTGSSVKVSYRMPDGQFENVRSTKVNSVIRSILPEDLSSYFFFDTERVENASSRKDLTSSVKGLLGLTTLDNAIKHVGTKSHKKSVLGQLYGSMDEDGDKRAQDALRKIQDAQERREAIAEQLETCNSEIEHFEALKEQLNLVLRNNESTTSLQRKKEQLEKSCDAEEQALASTIAALRNEFSNSSVSFFARPLVEAASTMLDKAEVADKGIKDLTQPTLEAIINRGTCICGLKFDEHPEAVAHIKNEMSFCPPESIGNAIRNYMDNLRSSNRSASQSFESIESRYGEIYRAKNRIQNYHDDIDDISEQIKGKEDMRQNEKDLQDAKRMLKDLSGKRDHLIREDESKKSEVDRYQKIYDQVAVVSDKNKKTMHYIRYGEAIYDWLTESYASKEGEVRTTLEDRVNGIFERMYHGRRRVMIDTRYQVELLTSISEDTEKQTGESKGLNCVKNFAFIAGLVSMAKDKIVSKAGDEEFDLSSESYPLVMDAPFSYADQIHIANISRVLPEIADQVVMFVMDKDWKYAEPVLRDRVGYHYELVQHSENYSELKEV